MDMVKQINITFFLGSDNISYNYDFVDDDDDSIVSWYGQKIDSQRNIDHNV